MGPLDPCREAKPPAFRGLPGWPAACCSSAVMRAHPLLLGSAAFIAACTAVPPTLAPLDDQVVAVGGELRLTLSASTQTGSSISYSFESNMPKVNDRAQLSERPDGTGIFVLKPLA